MTIFKITIVLGSILGLFLFFENTFADTLIFSQTESTGWAYSDDWVCNTFYVPYDTIITRGLFLVRNIGNYGSMVQFRIDGAWDNKFYAGIYLEPNYYNYLELYNTYQNPNVVSAGFHQFCYAAQYYFPAYGGQVAVNNAGFPAIFLYGSTNDYVNFLYPQNNNTYNQQQLNNFWTINFKFSTSTDFSLRAFVRWCNVDAPVGCNENNLYIIDDKVLGSSLYFSDNEWSTNIPFQGIFYNGIYKAQACLTKDDFLLSPFLCSDVITFYVQDVNLSNFSTSTPSQINLEGVCSPPQGGFLDYPVDNITYAFCRAITFLFIPNETQQNDIKNKFLNLSNEVKNKPPIGYFYKTKDLFNFTTTTTSTLISTSTYNKFSDIFNPLKNGIKIILFLAVGVFVIKKISNIFI